MRVVRQLTRRRVAQRSRHAEVDDERATALEPNQQVLATPVDRRDPLADERVGDETRLDRARQPRVDDLCTGDRRPLEHGRDLAANRLDLRQLGHGVIVGTRCRTSVRHPHYATTSSTMPRSGGGLVAELVRREDRRGREFGRMVVAGVHLGEVVACEDGVAALREAEDADCVVDRIVLRAAAGTQIERRVADCERPERA